MKHRARQARANLRWRRHWNRAQRVVTQPNLVMALQDCHRLSPIERRMGIHMIHEELMRRIFPEGL